MPCYDTQTLRLKGRALPTPFGLVLDAAEEHRKLECTTIHRNLPGKRLVCSGTWHRRLPVVAKIFIEPSGAERHYQRELQGIKALEDAQIPTPKLLFRGTLADGLAPLLLFQKMEGFETLTERLATRTNPDERLATLRPAIESIARLHAAGLRQRDIHPGNFLVSANQVMIIDGDDIEPPYHGPLPQKESMSNLALFFAQFYPEFDTIVPPLLNIYGDCRDWPLNSETREAIKQEILRWRDWRQKKYLRKIQRSCSAFIVKKDWSRFMACDRAWYSPSLQPLLANPDKYINIGTILKDGNTATVAKITIESQTLVVKRYNIKNHRHALRRCMRPSRAMVSWRNAHHLCFLGITTPQPLAVIEERWGGLRKRAYFIMAYLPGETIDQIIRAKINNPQAIEACLDQLEALLKQLAKAQISHGDFKATNFLISLGQLYLVDLDGMHSHRNPAKFNHAFRKDLQRLQRNWRDFPKVNRQLADLTDRLMHAFDMA
jgi:tRNA A-37 threonylcarbamoyl transferase component Bud32